MEIKNILGLVLVFLGMALLFSPSPTHAFTMVNKTMEETALDTFGDDDENGIPDGGVVIASLLYSKVDTIRITYVFQVEEWLSKDSDLQQKYPKGFFFTFKGTTLNPFAGLIGKTPGREYLMFLRENAHGKIILKSMKAAPITQAKLSDGSRQKIIRNPWLVERRKGTGFIAGQRISPKSEKVPLETFKKDFQDFETRILSIKDNR